MLKIKTVGNITLSKDGSKAAFTVTSIEPDETNKSDYKYLTQIYLLSATGNEAPVQLTTAKKAVRSPHGAPTESSWHLFALSMASRRFLCSP